MKKIFVFFLASLLYLTGFSQINCFTSFEFTSQAEIDSFPILYPGCVVLSDVTIEEDISGDITNLNALSNVIEIGILTIEYNDSLKDLTGLNSLTTLVDLTIRNNFALNSLDGLNNLTTIHIGGNLIIESCPKLSSLASLSNLTTLNTITLRSCGVTNMVGLERIKSLGYIEIERGAFVNFTGLDSLTSIYSLYVYDTFSMLDFTGLEKLTSIGGNLKIYYNDALQSLKGLDNVTSFGGNKLEIRNNYYLNDLTALSNLVSLDANNLGGAHLQIQRNNSLKNLAGLENIDPATISHLTISDNDSLTTCEVQSVCDYIGISTNTTDIQNNASGCNLRPEVEAACNPNSIYKNNFGSSLNFYPNPTKNQVNIELGETYSQLTINIRNTLGQLLDSQSFKRVRELELTLPESAGLYFVELKTTEGETAVIKLVKE